MRWRFSRHGVRPGQRGLRILQMYLKSGGVPAVLSGAMISMGRTVEKLGPALYSLECVEGGFTEVRCIAPMLSGILTYRSGCFVAPRT